MDAVDAMDLEDESLVQDEDYHEEEVGDEEPQSDGEEAEESGSRLRPARTPVTHALPEAQAGIVEKIKLVNFMNHAYAFNILKPFGPHVNFLTGPNGSGKSAVLVALTVGLGAKSRFVNRAERIGDLVMHGREFARILVTLRNRGSDAHQPDLYGERITIERRITRLGQSSWKVMGANGETHETAKREVDRILDKFSIQIENPCGILMQDTSRKFLTDAKPESKYKFFLLATQLEQMRRDYVEIEQSVAEAKSTIERKRAVQPDLQQRVDELKVELEELRRFERLEEQIGELRVKLAWVAVRDREAHMATVRSTVDDLKHKEELITRKMELVQRDLEVLVATSTTTQTEADKYIRLGEEAEAAAGKARADVLSLEKEEAALRVQIKDAAKRLGDAKRHALVVEGEIEKLNTQIAAPKRGEKNKATDQAKLVAKVETKRKDLDELNARLAALADEFAMVQTRGGPIGDQLRDFDEQLRVRRGELQRLEGQMGKGQNQSSATARLRVFGEEAPKLAELVALHAREFDRPPLGPIGSLVSLVDAKWTNAVNSSLERVARNWIVCSLKDGTALRSLASKNRLKVPGIIVQPWRAQKYGVPSGDVAAGTTVLDVLRCSEVVVINALIDQAQIERSLLVSSQDDARRFAFDRPDPRIAVVFDLDGTRYFMRNGTQITQTRLGKEPIIGVSVEERITFLKASKARLSTAVQALEEQRRAQFSAQKEINEHLKRLSIAKTSLEQQKVALTAEIDNVESELASLALKQEDEQGAANVAKLRALQERHQGQLEAQKPLEEALQKLQAKKESIEERKSPLEAIVVEREAALSKALEATGQLEGRVRSAMEAREKCEHMLRQLENRRAESARNRNSYQVDLDSSQLQLQAESQAASLIGPRPVMTDDDTGQSLDRHKTRLEQQLAKGRAGHRPVAVVIGDLQQAKEALNALSSELDDLGGLVATLSKQLDLRKLTWIKFRISKAKRTRWNFNRYLQERNFLGKLQFDHENEALHVNVNPNKRDGAAEKAAGAGGLLSLASDTHALSGGERSYSTVSLMLALWEVMELPFVAMDEFDVFMDQVNRKVSIQLLLDLGKARPDRQFIFISPHTTTHIQHASHVRIIKMRPPERGQGTLHNADD